MNQKFCYLSQRTQRKQRCAFTKNDVRLWDFGTLKSHSLKVSCKNLMTNEALPASDAGEEKKEDADYQSDNSL